MASRINGDLKWLVFLFRTRNIKISSPLTVWIPKTVRSQGWSIVSIGQSYPPHVNHRTSAKSWKCFILSPWYFCISHRNWSKTQHRLHFRFVSQNAVTVCQATQLRAVMNNYYNNLWSVSPPRNSEIHTESTWDSPQVGRGSDRRQCGDREGSSLPYILCVWALPCRFECSRW